MHNTWKCLHSKTTTLLEPSAYVYVLLLKAVFSFKVYGGMRGIIGLVTETSLLDPEEV